VESVKLTPAQIRRYFESRLPDAKFRGNTPRKMERCPFHSDSTASLSIDLDSGIFNCFGCNVNGGYLAFEMKFSTCDEATAWANIAELTGAKQQYIPGQKPEATYQYLDAAGRLAFEKLRYPGKRFSQRRPDGKGGWIYKLEGVTRKPLYNLPSLLVANEIVVAEGEKDADNAARAMKSCTGAAGAFIAGTTNFDGAGKWKDSESVYFAGKRVVIFEDNDEVGKKHAQQVASSIYPFALGVKVIQFPELPPHGDVSDFLKDHTAEQLVERIKKTQQWRPAESASRLLVTGLEFTRTIPDQIDWVVDGVIQAGANGMFAADPKAGKSFAAADLAVSLAIGADWLDFKITRPLRTALIAREDTPGLTAWRISHLLRGKTTGILELFGQNLWVNSKQQSPDYRLDIEELHREMIVELKARAIQFAILDVLNVLHSADENDNQEMRVILQKINEIQKETGCQIGLVHHFSKAEQGSLIKRIRGSSAISGWVEWAVGISVADQEMGIRKMEFETKADQPPASIYYRIVAEKDSGIARLQRTDYTQANKPKGKTAAELMQ
jgi:DNA primase